MSDPIERLAEHIGWVENETEPYRPTPEDMRLAKALRTIIRRYQTTNREHTAAMNAADSFQDMHVAEIRLWELRVVIGLLADAVNPEEK